MINPIPELTPLLKQLRLSGMTDSLAMRNREAIEHQLSYPDFLALLVQDEVARRDQKKYVTRLRRAGFRGNKTLESFDLNANPNLNRAYINFQSGEYAWQTGGLKCTNTDRSSFECEWGNPIVLSPIVD